MRRTATLRLLVIDRSELAKNMYDLLFRDLPGFRIEFASDGNDLMTRQRRARPHVVLVNSNALEKNAAPDFIREYPTVILAAPDRLDLQALIQDYEKVTMIEKPFYPYDLITVINRVASYHNPMSKRIEPAPAPTRRRLRRSRSAKS